MGEDTRIAWAHHTLNWWVGCQKVSPGCDLCYAEGWAKRSGLVGWGPHAERRLTSRKTRNQPLRWDRRAAERGRRERVFVNSLSDYGDNRVPEGWRLGLYEAWRTTHNLDYLVLTKRPENLNRFLPGDWGAGFPNVWLGTTVEDTAALRRIDHLRRMPAAVRFLSLEPLIEPVDLSPWLSGIDWVIVGGESGPIGQVRPLAPATVRALRKQCHDRGVRFFFKQTGSDRSQWPGVTGKGDTPDEWPEDLRVQEFPRPPLGAYRTACAAASDGRWPSTSAARSPVAAGARP